MRRGSSSPTACNASERAPRLLKSRLFTPISFVGLLILAGPPALEARAEQGSANDEGTMIQHKDEHEGAGKEATKPVDRSTAEEKEAPMSGGQKTVPSPGTPVSPEEMERLKREAEKPEQGE